MEKSGAGLECIAAGGVAIGAFALALWKIRAQQKQIDSLLNPAVMPSTTNSGVGKPGGGSVVYELPKATEEYLQFHYAAPKELMPYANGPTQALEFPKRMADQCFDAQPANTQRALDIGCAVGRSSFELARNFKEVVGIDFSHRFVDTAKAMGVKKSLPYTCMVEGKITQMRTAKVPDGVDAGRVSFEQGDACNLRADLGSFDAVLAGNLLCRLPDPKGFLQRCSDLVNKGGIFVLVSPYSWLEEYTPVDRWLGGKDAAKCNGALVQEILCKDFELVKQHDMPFMIREHSRKYQWGISDCTVWRRK